MRQYPIGVTLAIVLAGTQAPAVSLVDVCGNVNGSDSGDVTTADALLVLKRAVGQDIPLVCGPTGLTVRTGEYASYGEGSDGDRQDGASRSFLDNGDGTITDLSTGLMWEKKDNSGGIHDFTNRYTWSAGGNQMNGTLVSTFLSELNAGAGFAGRTDWRMPNRFELETLLNLSTSNPATHPRFNQCGSGCTLPDCSCTYPAFYWSSTTASNPVEAWCVSFSGGVATGCLKTDAGGQAVRAVRAIGEVVTAPTCQAPYPPQCSFNDPCTDGRCSLTGHLCSQQSDCPLSPGEECCCSGTCQ